MLEIILFFLLTFQMILKKGDLPKIILSEVENRLFFTNLFFRDSKHFLNFSSICHPIFGSHNFFSEVENQNMFAENLFFRF